MHPLAKVQITYPGDTVIDSFTALVQQPVSPVSAPPIDIGLVEINQPTEMIPGPPGPPGGVGIISDTAPPSPVHGDLWWESDTGNLYIWYADADSGQWVQVSGGSGGLVPVVSDTPIEDPVSGQLWWNSTNGNLYVWYEDGDSGQWVQINTASSGGQLTPQSFGAKADGVTDDTAALQAWLNALTQGKAGYAPAGTYLFTSPLTINVNEFAITGAGPYQTVFLYAGANTTNDLFVVGDGAVSKSRFLLRDFKIDSTTTMTGGNALWLKRVVRSVVENVTIGGQDGNRKLFNGVYFDRIDLVTYTGIDICTLNDGLKVAGITGAPQADLFLSTGKISGCGRDGIVCGGGFGGLVVDAIDIIANGRHGVCVDQSLQAEGSREILLLPGCIIDSNLGSGVYLNGGLGVAGYIAMTGVWNASNTLHGVQITASEVASRIQITGGNLFNNHTDGINIASTAPVVTIDGVLFRNNDGWGINNAAGGVNVRAGINYFSANTTGDVTGTTVLTTQNKSYLFGTGTPGTDRLLTLNGVQRGASNAYGLRNSMTAGQEVTSLFNGFSTTLSTEAASFTASNINHYAADQGTIGAGSTVSVQRGFVAQATMVGATSNIGFAGYLTAATGRYNFYAGGNAENSFAGPHTVCSALGFTNGGTAGQGLKMANVANFGIFFGAGPPTLSAAQGSLYLRANGPTNVTRLYVNTDGGTTWTGINTVA